ncbi:MAG: hypothetical protein JW889_05970 [Verrucomicrobia bacterium]|nr:hypothetical protein [Verrucomicrobiota bacterium]
MAAIRRERSFHKDMAVRIHRKRLFRRSEWCRAVLSDISRKGGRVLTREPMLEGYQIGIAIVDPDTELERELAASVKRVNTIDYRGKHIFELHVEFVGLKREDLILLENIFWV